MRSGEQVERLAREVHTSAAAADDATPRVQREAVKVARREHGAHRPRLYRG